VSTYQQTPGSISGIRRTGTEEEPGSGSRVFTLQPERLYFSIHDSDVDTEEGYDGFEGMCRKCRKIVVFSNVTSCGLTHTG
jgi:hypothetical protein